ncbi:MAG: hypothetical protein RMA76_10505 [Deltaproteobacteria bacterium]
MSHLLLIAGLLAAQSGSPEAVFKAAIEDFEFGEHAAAAKKLEGILNPIQLINREDIIVARQYLGACYQLLDDAPRAEEQFRLLLAMDDRHRLDPEVFSPALVEMFEQVRASFVPPPPPTTTVKVPPPPPPPVAAGPPPPIVIEKPRPAFEPHSRAMSFVPFGVGQFANAQPIKGALFAGGEAALLGTALTTFLLFESLKVKTIDGATGEVLSVEFKPEDADRARTLQTIYLATFWTGIVVVVGGIVEALISYPGDDVAPVAVEAGANGALVRF